MNGSKEHLGVLYVSHLDGAYQTSAYSDTGESDSSDAKDKTSRWPQSITQESIDGELADFEGSLLASFCTESFVDGRSSLTLLVYFSGLLGFVYPGTTFESRRFIPRSSLP